jgi:hypothetical protein
VVVTWLAPVMIGLTILLFGRAHYVLYVLKRGNGFSRVMTWLGTVLVTGFWTWQWLLK